MGNLCFENRVSLTRKSEDIAKTVAELSSCYAKREEFALKNPHALGAMRTSEICDPLPFFICYIYAIAVSTAGIAIVVLTEIGMEFNFFVYNDNNPLDGSDAYKNIV